ncbi:Protein of unknown function, partial [Cotesia congregata]
KADEMQNALMAKAADLKKDVDEIRRQMSDKKSSSEKDEADGKHRKKSASKGRKDSKSEVKAASQDSQSELSKLQSQHEEKDDGMTKESTAVEGEKVEDVKNETKSQNLQKSEEEIKEKTRDESATEEDRSSSRDEVSVRSKRSIESGSQVSESDKESVIQTEKADDKKSEDESRNLVDGEKKETEEVKKNTEVEDKKEEMNVVQEVEGNDKEKTLAEDKKEKLDEKAEHDEHSEKVESMKVKSAQETVPQESSPSAPKSVDKQEPEGSASDNLRHIDSSSSSAKSSRKLSHSRPSTGKSRRASSKSSSKKSLFESSEERSPDRSAIVAVIESPEWDEEDEEVAKEIRDVVGDAEPEEDSDAEDEDSLGVLRVIPSTSEEESPRRLKKILRESKRDKLPRVERKSIGSPRGLRIQTKQRRDSGGRDSGIEPSPRVSKIPKRTLKCYPNTEKQQALNIDTITRDVQISLRRYHLERKIFFQLMELKRLQIRHGRANEQVLVKRQVEMFHKAGMSGPALGVAKYDQAYTFKDFETFLYEQLRRLQRRPPSSDKCTDPKQCTKKTHRCHHATSAYTSVPVFTYLGGGSQERDEGSLFPRIESRGKGQMTVVEVTRGEEKQIIALPAEKLDRTKRYFVTFTVRGDNDESDIKTPRNNAQRATKSV